MELIKVCNIEQYISLVRNNKVDSFDIGVKDAVDSKSTIVHYLKNDDGLFKQFKIFFYDSIADYIEIYYPGTNAKAVATEFVNLTIKKYITWTIVDVNAYINFAKEHQPERQSGHKISPLELLEVVVIYEEEKCKEIEERERLIKQSENFVIEIPTTIKNKDTFQGAGFSESHWNKIQEKNKDKKYGAGNVNSRYFEDEAKKILRKRMKENE